MEKNKKKLDTCDLLLNMLLDIAKTRVDESKTEASLSEYEITVCSDFLYNAIKNRCIFYEVKPNVSSCKIVYKGYSLFYKYPELYNDRRIKNAIINYINSHYILTHRAAPYLEQASNATSDEVFEVDYQIYTPSITDYLIHNSIKKVIFNDPATIIIWQDDSKTVVKCSDEEQFDKEKGLAMALVKHCFFHDSDTWYKQFRKQIDTASVQSNNTQSASSVDALLANCISTFIEALFS